MKKFLTLCLSLLACGAFTTAQAEINNTFQFVDKNGQVVADGTIINATETVVDDYGSLMIPSGLFVKNNSNTDASLIVKYDITRLPNGQFSICYPEQCTFSSATGKKTTTPGTKPGGSTASLASEWLPEEGTYGTCTVIFQLVPVNITNPMLNKYEELGEGPTVTVNFIYSNEIKGDLNGDGKINVADAEILINAILAGESDSKCDIDGNGTVDVSDVTALINIMLAEQQ